MLELLSEAEFVSLVTEGRSIKTVIPDVPFYERLFRNLGEAASPATFSEPERLAVDIANRLAGSPLAKEAVYGLARSADLLTALFRSGRRARSSCAAAHGAATSLCHRPTLPRTQTPIQTSLPPTARDASGKYWSALQQPGVATQSDRV